MESLVTLVITSSRQVLEKYNISPSHSYYYNASLHIHNMTSALSVIVTQAHSYLHR